MAAESNRFSVASNLQDGSKPVRQGEELELGRLEPGNDSARHRAVPRSAAFLRETERRRERDLVILFLN